MTRQYAILKRFFDVVTSTIGLVLLSPVMTAVAGVVFLSMGRPVLFRQTRPGLRARPFVVYKFRTMNDARDARGEPLRDAARMTPVGRFIRSTSLDELPQLWNVLRGDMSIVGPRPLLMEYLPLYSAQQARRHEVRPGLTTWNAVNGRNLMTWEEQFAMDVWYVDNVCFALDLKIILLTFVKVVQREGVTQAGSATRERFRGTSGFEGVA